MPLLKNIFLSVLLIAFSLTAIGQKAKKHQLTEDEAKLVKKDAATMFSSGDYKGALKAYQDLYNSDKQNSNYNYQLGLCYLSTTINKRKALEYLENAARLNENKKELKYYLGLAYMYNERWDEAIAHFTEYRSSESKPAKDFTPPERLIEMCNNAKTLTSKPVNCIFTNPGKNVNTVFEEYNPCISADGNSLLFTTRRKGNMGGFIPELGIFTADIYWSYWKDTIWSKARGIGANINSEWDEESVGLSPAGDQILMYFDNAEAFADIGIASLRGKVWQVPSLLSTQVNSKADESGACISLDGNTIYFSSNRKDGKGGSDIWYVKKDDKGKWGSAVNAGVNINTGDDEINPFLTADGKKLYFASKGWNSMGGYDIFYSRWDDESGQWKDPVNAGYPVNNAEDNSFISFTGTERYAYVSAVRPDGLGDLDIFRIEFLDTIHHSFNHLLHGSVSTRVEVTGVSLTNNASGEKMDYVPAPGSTNFIFAVVPGEYTLKIDGYKFSPYEEQITIPNTYPPAEIEKIIQVKATR